MKRRSLAVTIALLLGAILGGGWYAHRAWIAPPRLRVERLDARAAQLEERARERWTIADGLSPTRDANLVPTHAWMQEMRRALGAMELADVDAVRSSGRLPVALTARLERDAASRVRLERLAEGRYGEPTDLTQRDADEVVAWMIALATVERARCFDVIVDAVRVAQAVQRAPRHDPRPENDPIDEAVVVGALEPALVACGYAASPAERRRAVNALMRLDASRGWPAPPSLLLREAREILGAQRARLDADLFAAADWAALAAVDRDLDHVARLLAHGGGVHTLDASYEDADGDGINALRDIQYADLLARVQIRVLAGVLLAQSDEPVDELRVPGTILGVVRGPDHVSPLVAPECGGVWDGYAPLAPEP